MSRVRADPPRDLSEAILAGAGHPLIVFDVREGGELRVAAASRTALDSGLLRVANPTGLDAREALEPEPLAALLDGYTECLRLGGPFAYEEFVHIDGAETWWMTNLTPLFGPDGRPYRLVATHLPLTFVARTEDALRRSQASFKGLIESSPDAVFVLDAASRIAYANPAAASLLRATTADLAGKPLESFASLDARARTTEWLARAKDAVDGSASLEVTLIAIDGTLVATESVAIRHLFEGAPSVLVMARDVTHVRQMQAELSHSERMASLGRLAAGVAHEVNNPLAFIHANLHFALGELERLDPSAQLGIDLGEVKGALSEALDGAGRVRAIVRDLKDLAISEDSSESSCDVGRAVSSAATRAASTLAGRAVLVTHLDDLPRVACQEPRLSQILLNLLVNAAHAIEPGKEDANEIKVSASRVGSDVVIEVRDTGAGMAPDVAARAFEPFFSTKPPGGGTGLGLTLCRRIVSAAGGRIWLESAKGAGTVARVALRAIEPTADATERERQRQS